MSGQLDIVVEYPFLPSLPIVAGKSPRLYLAEGIVAVIEVKSNVCSHWDEVQRTVAQLSKLNRDYKYETGVSIGPRAMAKIPLFAVGYIWWKDIEKVHEYVNLDNGINGILVIEQGHFVGKYPYLNEYNKFQPPFTQEVNGSSIALWGLIPAYTLLQAW